MDKRWQLAQSITSEADQNLLRYSSILRQVLFNRGFTTETTALQYLKAEPPLENNPMQLSGMLEAVERIRWAIQKRESIAIYGDYDADGVTATALLVQVLQILGGETRGYIPNRFDQGYGLNKEALGNLYNDGVRLVITVDCGVRSPQETKYARGLGLDMIITDHHAPDNELPDVTAIINPKQSGDTYPDKDLAGVGLAYKLACALLNGNLQPSSGFRQALPADEFLDLVALGTVTDLAPLTGENRALVRSGIKYIRQPHRLGVRSLIGVAGLSISRINASNIGFILGPRLNAAGRLDSALAALNLLLTNDPKEAGLLAQQLDNQNRERQKLMREIQQHAEKSVMAQDPDAFLLFAVDSNYNPGVVGLAASRLVEQYYRPAIVAVQGEENTRGSCRSIREFHITQALDECSDLLLQHGGHAAAAGFSVRNENLAELIGRLKAIAERELGSLDLRPTLTADAQIMLGDLYPELLKEMDWLQPTGSGNPQAVFVSRNIKVNKVWPVGNEAAHLKMQVSDISSYEPLDAIAFRQGHLLEQLPPKVDLMYTYELNDYSNRPQLNVIDLRPAGTLDS